MIWPRIKKPILIDNEYYDGWNGAGFPFELFTTEFKSIFGWLPEKGSCTRIEFSTRSLQDCL